jgi:tRNA A-37 threonylcarbamoyl transferase component Bud32
MSPESNIGRVLGNKYEIVRVLGVGGMGAVFEVRHRLINRRFAVKLLHEEYATDENVVERFKREATTTAAIGHDNIVDITDMGMSDTGELYIVMEFLDGRDLFGVLEESRVIEAERACHLMLQILSALSAAHERGIVHRDLKPGHIFIIKRNDADFVKLVDFGISKVRASEDSVQKGLTRTGQLLGTPSYMSPEQARGESDITSDTDIYSMGVILFEVLTGERPFDADGYVNLLMKILTEEAPDPMSINPDLDPGLAAVILKAMAKEPADRYENATEFMRAILPYSPNTSEIIGLDVSEAYDKAADVGRAGVTRTPGPGRLLTTPLELSDTRDGQPRAGAKKLLAVGIIVMAALAIIGALAFWPDGKGGDEIHAPVVPLEQTPIAVPETNVTPAPATPTETSVETPVENEAPAKSSQIEARPRKNKKIKLRIGVHPAGAEIFLDGRSIGVGSTDLVLPTDDEEHVIEVTASDHVAEKKKISLKDHRTLVFKLKKMKSETPKNSKKVNITEVDEPAAPKPAAPEPKPDPVPAEKQKRKIDEDEPW